MKIEDLREEIDRTDAMLVELFNRRMDIVKSIAEYKTENNIPIYDSERERKLFDRVATLAGEKTQAYVRTLYAVITDLSRSYQGSIIHKESGIVSKIKSALENTPKLFPQKATVACQGTEGAYSQLACEKLFELPSIMYFNNWDNVFSAVESGLCRYGILPIENSTAGTVNRIYDLMTDNNFSIVRSVKIKTSHTLLVNSGVKLSDVKEIISHEQAIQQCDNFLRELKGVKVTYCENTAVAAKTVRDSGRKDLAAISSRPCSALYGLSILPNSIQNNDVNYTRFICISKNTEIYPGANKTSFMLSVPNKPGSLYRVMSKFSALGINLTKLESRPIPGSEFEFLFYLDVESSVYSPALFELINELAYGTDRFRYLGSYSEMT
ncbi:MAG: prephenate dehydratase domain-containing protein [Eubacteriales bacterium]|nr:prephenate dehydratase domain-containing protein [Eubacteriales bacterium]MDD4422530.1 prephenate dehydratase domain-containing protein [Eubacteriales bacterium]